MERKVILTRKNDEYRLESDLYLLDLDKQNSSLSFKVSDNSNCDILILNLNDGNDIHFEVENNALLHVAILAKNALNSFKISTNVGENSQFDGYFADFIKGKCKGDIEINLNKSNAICNWHLASLAMEGDKKVFDVSSYHNSPNTISNLDNYGVVRENGKLEFSGICKIFNGSHASKAHQNAKIMVFDALSDGIAKPILKIDDNEIEASHAAVVGKINDEHIFYLTSRGLSIDEAKRIITLGYLKPILNGFQDEDIKVEIENIIEGNM